MFPFAHSVPSAGFALRGWYVLHLLRSCTLWMRIHVLVFPNSNNNLVQFIISGIGVCLGIHHLLLSASLDISYPKKCIPFFFFSTFRSPDILNFNDMCEVMSDILIWIFLSAILFQEYLQTCMNKLENLFEQHRRLCYSVNITAQNIPPSNNNNNNNCNTGNNIDANKNNTFNSNNNSTPTNNNNSPSLEMTPPQQTNIQSKSKSQSGTPTDVQDVKF